MKSQGKLDIQYAETMENHPFGIALYRPTLTTELRPGIVGYFDEFGSWNTIADLADHDGLQKKGLSPPSGELTKAPTDSGIVWGPKMSSSTKATKIDLSAGVSPAPGIPATVSAVYCYQVSQDAGAILLTSAPISHERYYHATPFKNWLKENASAVLTSWRDEVKENGIWIVTSTFSTKKCAINMWTKKGKTVKVGFSADVMGAGNIDPGVDWYRSHTDDGWGEYIANGDERYVVFFGGLKFRFNQGFRKVSQNLVPAETRRTDKKHLQNLESRDGEDDDEEDNAEYITTIPDPDNVDREFEVDCTDFVET